MSTVRSLPPVRRLLAAALAVGLALLSLPLLAADAASPAAAWKISVISMPTNFVPGTHGTATKGPRYEVVVTNVGGADATGPVTVTDTLPAGLTPGELSKGCSAAGQVITCTITEDFMLRSGERIPLALGVDVSSLGDPTVLEPNEVTVSSSGTAPASATTTTTVTSEEAPFGFVAGPAGLAAHLTEADGAPVAAAGGRPSQFTVNLALQTKPGTSSPFLSSILATGGGARDISTYLPPGLVLDPAATPVRCTESEFETNLCPDASAIGRSNTLLGLGGAIAVTSDPVFNLVPPPGYASSFAFDPISTGLHVHILGSLRNGDYTLTGVVHDLPSLFTNQLYAAQLQFWGDPSSPTHDEMRGFHCGVAGSCPVPPQDTALISNPTSCTNSLAIETEADSWVEPGRWLKRSAPFTDLQGNPTGVSGCNAVPFAPRLSVQPTTNLADSPTGLNVDLKIPQSESLSTTASAHLKDASVTLPEGLVVNPSSANGLASCSSAQVGIDPATGVADGDPVSCPDASKIGTVEVESPLLAQYDSENKVERDAEGNVIPEPVPGSVYIATPTDNPFHSLLAIYLVLDDPEHGILVKLAGHVEADPQTGRLTTTFANNPQLPVSDFKLHFFGGAGAALRSPLSCGAKMTTSVLTPWSTPEGADATPSDSFQTSAEPGGGPCPGSDDQAPNRPAFSAGTIAPKAGAYSPFVLKLSREDGTAPIASIDTTLPAGLTGKLAGIAYCPDSSLAAAAGKSGTEEKASPSCPDDSKVGTVYVGAGAGPTPYYTQGTAYLAGPYKGAPLSLAIVTPATAGPYDLGTVVVRTALYVDPETARIHAVSDPIPQILQGIPLDVRSISLRMDRPDFTLNPTSCNPMAVTGSATSPFGSSASLQNPFQVGGCSALTFKPKLALTLKGGTKRGRNPALKAVLTMPTGGANIAKASVSLPHSEFLDQAHIKTICTRVQFAAKQCPPGSVYGRATAVTPLLDQPLSGPVYLRSSSHKLPDLVADLNGQIHVVLVGRIDSHKGGIRNTFEGAPDAPVSKFVLEMQGGKKGLLENSTDLCRATQKATVLFDGQNGKTSDSRVALRSSCKKAGRHERSQNKHRQG